MVFPPTADRAQRRAAIQEGGLHNEPSSHERAAQREASPSRRYTGGP